MNLERGSKTTQSKKCPGGRGWRTSVEEYIRCQNNTSETREIEIMRKLFAVFICRRKNEKMILTEARETSLPGFWCVLAHDLVSFVGDSI